MTRQLLNRQHLAQIPQSDRDDYIAMAELLTDAGHNVLVVENTYDGATMRVQPSDSENVATVVKRRCDGCFWSTARIPDVFENIQGDGAWLYKFEPTLVGVTT